MYTFLVVLILFICSSISWKNLLETLLFVEGDVIKKKMERFWINISRITGFHTKSYFEIKFSLFFIKKSPLILA